MAQLFERSQMVAQAAMQKPCKGCYYLGGGSCNYLVMVGHRRPCPPGAKCTEYRTSKGSTPQDRAHVGAMSGAFPSAPHKGKLPKRQSTRVYRSPAMAVLETSGAADLYAQGASDGAIAKAVGVSARSVGIWRKKTGRKRNYEPGERPREKRTV